MSIIITIGRAFGSGGRELGRRLSEDLGIAYYDQEIITEIATRTSLSEQYVRQVIERKPIVSFPIHIGTTLNTTVNPVMQQTNAVFQEQCNILREMADKSDCVIVGRCGDYILREHRPFRVFVYADMASRIIRCREKGPEGEGLSDRELEKRIREIDRRRASYYEFYTGQKWGDRDNYDLCINTTGLVIKDFTPALAALIRNVRDIRS